MYLDSLKQIGWNDNHIYGEKTRQKNKHFGYGLWAWFFFSVIILNTDKDVLIRSILVHGLGGKVGTLDS